MKSIIYYSRAIDGVDDNLEDYNPTKKRRVLIMFDDMIAVSPIVTKLFLRGRKVYISVVFLVQSCFKMPKTIRLNAAHYIIIEIPNKRDLQQIASNHSSDMILKIS